ncbi:MAG: hypothetical protein BWK80_04815 [Desulfobacteraceae bacterium IS3]|nr:MAG: hypothetical protein BWK80_04815 [Desulfobacteraceae bacterium IS3]
MFKFLRLSVIPECRNENSALRNAACLFLRIRLTDGAGIFYNIPIKYVISRERISVILRGGFCRRLSLDFDAECSEKKKILTFRAKCGKKFLFK